MVKKILKKKKETTKVPKFYIVRCMINERESYRELIDNVHFLSWSALTNHKESVGQAKRLQTWSVKFKDTYESMLKAHLESQDEDTRERNRYIVGKITKNEPYYTTYGPITYEYEPMDEVEYEHVLSIQKEHQRVERERIEAERLRKEKERIKNRARNLLKRKFA